MFGLPGSERRQDFRRVRVPKLLTRLAMELVSGQFLSQFPAPDRTPPIRGRRCR